MDLAYEKAKEGGYKGRLYAPKLGAELFDKDFWQCLGKSLGWDCSDGECVDENCKGGTDKWKSAWHRFIDHLAEGKDIESFFISLME